MELIYNLICLGVALFFGLGVIVVYRAMQPKFYGYLLWALILILSACLTFSLYMDLLEVFQSFRSDDKEVTAAAKRLSENMKLFAFAVPGLMLAVAANLITTFMQAPKPEKKINQ